MAKNTDLQSMAPAVSTTFPALRPPGATATHIPYYKTRHYAVLGLPRQLRHTSVTPTIPVEGSAFWKTHESDYPSDLFLPEASTPQATSDDEERRFTGCAETVAAGTAELVAACAKAKRRRAERDEIKKGGRTLEIGRAARAAMEKRKRHAQDAEKRQELATEERERINLAQEDLNSALVAQHLEFSALERRRQVGLKLACTIRLQRFFRVRKEKKYLLETQDERREKRRKAQQDLFDALRRPRAVRFVGEFATELRNAELRTSLHINARRTIDPTREYWEKRSDYQATDSAFTSTCLGEDSTYISGSSDDDDEERHKSDTVTGSEILPTLSLPRSLYNALQAKRDVAETLNLKLKLPQADSRLKATMTLMQSLQKDPENEMHQKNVDLHAKGPGKDRRTPSKPNAVSPLLPRTNEEALHSLRELLMRRLEEKFYSCEQKRSVAEVEHLVREKYLEYCRKNSVKPNSRVMVGVKPTPESENGHHVYDFTDAHIGDRGLACLLKALTVDPQCSKLSLRCCGLHEISASIVACFMELAPGLSHIDLSHNSLSFKAGEMILTALRRRPDQVKEMAKYCIGNDFVHLPGEYFRPKDLTVDLTNTPLAWGGSGITVGPPCGTIWARSDHRDTPLTPSGYEKLRDELSGTHLVKLQMCEPDPEDLLEAKMIPLLSEPMIQMKKPMKAPIIRISQA